MRKVRLALVTVGATVLAGFAASMPAAARDYPWCAQGGDYDYPGECAYSTYAQCQASVSGRLLFCGPNPLAFPADTPPPRPRPHPRRRTIAPD